MREGTDLPLNLWVEVMFKNKREIPVAPIVGHAGARNIASKLSKQKY